MRKMLIFVGNSAPNSVSEMFTSKASLLLMAGSLLASTPTTGILRLSRMSATIPLTLAFCTVDVLVAVSRPRSDIALDRAWKKPRRSIFPWLDGVMKWGL